MSRLLELLRQDLAWTNIVEGKPLPPRKGWGRILSTALHARGFRAVLLYRLARRVHLSGHNICAAILAKWTYRSTGADISPTAEIAGGLRIPHPQGVVIGADVQIGQMVTIGQHVTLGGNFGKRDSQGRMFPRVGDWCWICAGSVVAGPVHIGEYAIVGANSVVTRDVPRYAVVGGVPAKVIRLREQPGPLDT